MNKIKDINQGDILAFKSDDGRFKALLCTSTYKERSPQNFTFCALTIDQREIPTIDNILNSLFFGIGNRKDEYYKCSENELERMWAVHPEIRPHFLGSYGFIIWRKDFIKFRENFTYIGNISIVDNLDKKGNGGVNASDWMFLKGFFNEKFKHVLHDRGQKLFRIKAILKG